MLAKRLFLFCFFSLLMIGFGSKTVSTQDYRPDIHVIVNMVQLNVAVTDKKGNYVTGLRPEDFVISEDGIAEKIATFGEGNGPTRRMVEGSGNANSQPESPVESSRELARNDMPGTASPRNDLVHNDSPADPEPLNSLVAGSNVFVLFDTSN